MRIALTRPVPASINDCELSFLGRERIDVSRAAAQHVAYEQALERAGCEIRHLPAEDALPDCVFVEDTAVIFDELAVMTHPGAPSRGAETVSVAAALAAWRTVSHIQAPGTLDGGDVLVVGATVYVGASARTNREGVGQLAALLEPHGYAVRAVPVERCLHLKSAITEVADRTVLLNPGLVEEAYFADLERIRVDPEEPQGANALRIGSSVLYGVAYPRTRVRLESAGISVIPVDLAELAKAEGAVTCCSLIVPLL